MYILYAIKAESFIEQKFTTWKELLLQDAVLSAMGFKTSYEFEKKEYFN